MADPREMTKDDSGEAPEMHRERQAAHDVASWDAAFAAALAATNAATNAATDAATDAATGPAGEPQADDLTSGTPGAQVPRAD